MHLRTEAQRQIEAALRDIGINHGIWARAATMRAAAEPAEDGAIDWILTTELPALVWDWDRWDFVNEVLLADGMMVPAIGQVPLLDSHKRQSAHDVLGHVEGFFEAAAGEYPARGGKTYFAADAPSQIVKQKVVDRHITDGSVGYQVTKAFWVPEEMTVSINGKSFTGPLKVSTEWSLKEFSITPIGADVLAKVRRLCGGGCRLSAGNPGPAAPQKQTR